jgi:hypothetical protein
MPKTYLGPWEKFITKYGRAAYKRPMYGYIFEIEYSTIERHRLLIFNEYTTLTQLGPSEFKIEWFFILKNAQKWLDEKFVDMGCVILNKERFEKLQVLL